jgi:hypothetical protein
MGYVTTGKPLTADHPFFLTSEKEDIGAGPVLKSRENGANRSVEDDSEDEYDDDIFPEEEENAMQAHPGHAEDQFGAEDNTFFDAEEYHQAFGDNEKNGGVKLNGN